MNFPEPSKLMMSTLFIIALVLLAFGGGMFIVSFLVSGLEKLRPGNSLNVLSVVILAIYFTFQTGYSLFISRQHPDATVKPLSRKDATILFYSSVSILLIFVGLIVAYRGSFFFISKQQDLAIYVFVAFIIAVLLKGFRLYIFKEKPITPLLQYELGKWGIVVFIPVYFLVIYFVIFEITVLTNFLFMPTLLAIVFFGNIISGYSRNPRAKKYELLSQKNYLIPLVVTGLGLIVIGIFFLYDLFVAINTGLVQRVTFLFNTLATVFVIHYAIIFFFYFLLVKTKILYESASIEDRTTPSESGGNEPQNI